MSGGKSPRAAGTGEIGQSRETLFEKALAPLADHLAAGLEDLGDLVIGEALSGEKDHLGTDNLEVRRRIPGSHLAEMMGFRLGQDNSEWAFPGHTGYLRVPMIRSKSAPVYVSVFMSTTT